MGAPMLAMTHVLAVGVMSDLHLGLHMDNVAMDKDSQLGVTSAKLAAWTEVLQQ